jgi:hypothetical protein
VVAARQLALAGSFPNSFYDVNGDNSVAADDVIAVVNYINAGLGGEAEGDAAAGTTSSF